MEAAATTGSSQFHSGAHHQQPTRSVSLPSRLRPNPLTTTIDQELGKSQSSQTSTTASTPKSARDLHEDLGSLAELYLILNQHIQPPSNIRERGRLLVEQALDRSVIVLDVCSTARDMITELKEQVRNLQSGLRRRKSAAAVERNLHDYFRFKKTANKDVSKCLRVLKRTESKYAVDVLSAPPADAAEAADAASNTLVVIGALRKVNGLTVSILRSLLVFLSAHPQVHNTRKSTAARWSTLVSKIMVIRAGSPKVLTNELGSVDVSLYSLLQNGNTSISVDSTSTVQARLRSLESSMQSLEHALDRLYKHLVHNRVSLLNILAF